jgi:hypothetical protein
MTKGILQKKKNSKARTAPGVSQAMQMPSEPSLYQKYVVGADLQKNSQRQKKAPKQKHTLHSSRSSSNLGDTSGSLYEESARSSSSKHARTITDRPNAHTNTFGSAHPEGNDSGRNSKSFNEELAARPFPNEVLFHDFRMKRAKRELDLSGWHLTADDLEYIGKHCQQMTKLILGDCGDYINTQSIEFLDDCHFIETLDLQNCANVDDSAMAAFRKKHGHLTWLNITGCRVSGVGLERILSASKRLHTLIVQNNPLIDDEALSHIAGCCRSFGTLRYLDISGCKGFSDRGMLVMFQESHKLHQLDLSNCTQITDLALMGFVGRAGTHMALISLNLSGLQIHDSGLSW